MSTLLNCFYLNESKEKISIDTHDLSIRLPNGQTLSLSIDSRSNGLLISDHCLQDNGAQSSEYAVLSITPGACNLVVINSEKQLINK